MKRYRMKNYNIMIFLCLLAVFAAKDDEEDWKVLQQDPGRLIEYYK